MQYEFKQIEISGNLFKSNENGNEKIEARLNALSAGGWALVKFHVREVGGGFVYLFKRPVAKKKDP